MERTLVEAVNDALHVEMERDELDHGHGRGRGPRGRRLPRHGRAARPFRRRPLRRHAAGRSRDPRDGDRACHGGLAPRVRDAVRVLQLPLPRPADHARRPLPLAYGRRDGVPAHDPHAHGRRRPRARAARGFARGLLRAHAGREGGDPVDAVGCQGPARRGDPRPGPGRDHGAEGALPEPARRGARGRARGPAREGAHRARGHRRDARGLRRHGADLPRGGRAARRERGGRGHSHPQAARRGGDPRVRWQDRARGHRAGSPARRRLRRRDRRGHRREGDPRPPGPDPPRDRLRRALPVLVDRARVPADARARGRGRRKVLAY